MFGRLFPRFCGFWVLIVLLVLLALPSRVAAAQLSRDAFVSLITSGPSDMAVFTAWGHSAIRVCDPYLGIDKTFNYGIFHFGPDFLPRFVSGRTDYRLGVSSMARVLEETSIKGAPLFEQVLNLNHSEMERLYNALLVNYEPQNRYYRYKYFSDNCATRPLAQLSACLDGRLSLVYPQKPRESYRDCIHRLLLRQPWYVVGIDICLGQPIDCAMSPQERLFLPQELMEALQNSSISSPDSLRRVVWCQRQLLPASPASLASPSPFLAPLPVLFFLLLATALHVCYHVGKNKSDSLVVCGFYSLLGLVGCLVFYVTLLSQHQMVWPNANILWLNPLPLLVAGLCLFSATQRLAAKVMLAVALLSLLYPLALIFLGQRANAAFWPIIAMQLMLAVEWAALKLNLVRIPFLQK